MLTLPSSVHVYVAAEPVDLRRGFDGLAAATRELVLRDPLSGHLFCFLNRRSNRIKILLWDRSGYLLIYKRLERLRRVLNRPAEQERETRTAQGQTRAQLHSAKDLD